MIPVLASKVRPDGSVPPDCDSVTGAFPPVAEAVALYAVPRVPSGSVAGESIGAGYTLSGYVWVAVRAAVSVAATATLKSPAALAIPEIAPDPLIDSPAGSPEAV